MRATARLLIAVLLFSSAASAQSLQTPQEDERSSGVTERPVPELQFIGYSFHRFTGSNIAPTNELLRGQVIGRLFGPNTTTTVPQTALYGESRFVPLFVYRPWILDGAAVFRGLFKVDFTWGDAAYGVGNNSGGAISGATVNLQTLMANVEIRPSDDWNVVVGLQRIFDNPRDPNVNTLTTAQTSGSRLMFWGTQGVGVASYMRLSPVTIGRLGFFQLYENGIQNDDDVILYMADAETRVAPLLEIGGNIWYVHDRGAGGGGVSVLGQGFNSALVEYNGGARLQLGIPKYKADMFWTGLNLAYDRDFIGGRWWGSGIVMANVGMIDTIGAAATARKVDIFGVAVHGSLYYKYGQTSGDRVGAEVLFTSPDPNGGAGSSYSGVVTGNTWGSPVGIYSSHKAYLLFADPQVVNRYYSAVHDISNMGYGTTAFFLNYYNNLVPNKWQLKLGGAGALANARPAGGGAFIGAELNAEVKYTYRTFFDIGLSAAYMVVGDFYNSPAVRTSSGKPANPWVAFATVSWLMF
jgi:hypothetical protein